MAVQELAKSPWTINSPLHNRLSPEDRPIHAWYRFVLSFPPHLVRTYIEDFGLAPGSTVLDPFCGTGTTLVEAKKAGIQSVGIEANPMAAFASETKLDWSPDPAALRTEGQAIAQRARSEFQALDVVTTNGVVAERRTLFGLLTLDDEAERLLLKGSISPLPLHRTLSLLELIDKANKITRNHLRLALAWTLINDAGNIRFGPEVGITAPKQDVDVVTSWLNQVGRMANDLLLASAWTQGASTVLRGDSRTASASIEPGTIDAIITSPPYPNEKDYTRTTRLESVVLGLVKTKAELRHLKQGLLRSNTRNVYVDDNDDHYVSENPEIQRVAAEIEARRIELGKTSGFERLYHRVTKLYFGGMAKHLKQISHLLRPGAQLAYVVGDQASYLRVMIRTGALLEQIATAQGYEVVRRDLFRTRWATATKEQLREEVVVLRWPGSR